MNIKIKDYPLIRAIESGKSIPFTAIHCEDTEYQKTASILEGCWENIAEVLYDNVFFLSHTYLKAFDASWGAFRKLICDEKDECQKDDLMDMFSKYNRLFIDNETFGCMTFWLNVNIQGMIICASFAENGSPVCINIKDSDTGNDMFWHIDKTAGEGEGLFFMLMLLLMEKYAPVEERLIKPGQRVRPDFKRLDTIENKSMNGLIVHIRDSRWFTTIVRNEDFNVRGFFRLQPKKKDGEWTRELIYIKPFVKHGYHRMADVHKLKDEQKLVITQ